MQNVLQSSIPQISTPENFRFVLMHRKCPEEVVMCILLTGRQYSSGSMGCVRSMNELIRFKVENYEMFKMCFKMFPLNTGL